MAFGPLFRPQNAVPNAYSRLCEFGEFSFIDTYIHVNIEKISKEFNFFSKQKAIVQNVAFLFYVVLRVEVKKTPDVLHW